MPARYCPYCFRIFDPDDATCPRCQCPRPPTGWLAVLRAGELLDRHYRIQRVLAVAGAGLTYQAHEIDADGAPLPTPLAIKVLYAHHASGRQLERLSTEAQILQTVRHPNLVELRAFVNRTGSAPYLVTLFEHGGNLREHLERHGALPLRVAAGILVQVLGALSVTHAREIVHRDLKPDNLLLREPTEAGQIPIIRVTDFGVAKIKSSMGTATVQGAFVGTPEYAAPEQFHGGKLSAATDIFAAGCLLVECLRGTPPLTFADRTDLEACARSWDAVLPYVLNVPGPIEVQGLITAMLHPDPTQRPPIEALLRCLEPISRGEPAMPLQAAPIRKPTKPEPPAKAAPSGSMASTTFDEPAPDRVWAGLSVLGLGSLGVLVVLCLVAIVGAVVGLGYLDGPPIVRISQPR